MNFVSARSLYNSLPNRARVIDALIALGTFPVEIESAAFGTIAFDETALRAIDLDNLFSGRCQGDVVEASVLAAMNKAADVTDPDADFLRFEVSFGALGSAKLMALSMPDWIRVTAAQD